MPVRLREATSRTINAARWMACVPEGLSGRACGFDFGDLFFMFRA
jgi:hypothetical protein